MGTYSDMLFGGQLEEVQAPIERPAPIRRPGEAAPAPRPRVAPPAAAAPMPAQDAPVVDYWSKYEAKPPAASAPSPMEPAPPPARRYSDDLFGVGPTEAPAAQPPRNPASVDPNAEPDAQTWMGRRVQDVVGKQDPRFKGLPTIAEVLNKEKSTTLGTAAQETWGWLTGAEDKDMAGVYKSILGDRFLGQEQDANGYPVIVYKGQDGKEARAYVNQPGLDMQDVVRGVTGIAPNIGAGRLVSGAMKGAALVPRMVGQAMGQAGASAAQDAAGAVTGVTELDPEKSAIKAGISAAGGAGGELLGAAAGALWRKFVTEPRYFDKATGQLTQQGMKAAQEAGLDPSMLTQGTGVLTGSGIPAQKFAAEMARTGDPSKAIQGVVSNEFKVPRTQGEVTGNTQQLLREQQMIGGAYGETAQKGMQSFRAGQEQAMQKAAGAIGDDLAPSRAGLPMSKGDIGQNIRANTQGVLQQAKEFEKKAWNQVPELTATDDMLKELPASISGKMQNILVTEGRTPQAAAMIKDLETFIAGEAPQQVSKLLPASPARNIDQMRRQLLDSVKAAATPEDKRAAGALYDAYGDWIETAARMSGDPSVAGNMIIARGVTRELKQTFQGAKGSPGSRIMADILEKSDSPEGIVNALFLNPASSEIKRGSLDALKSLKRAYDTYWPRNSPEAKAAWDDIRLAYWLKVVEKKTGEQFGPAQLSSNIKAALNNQKSISEFLFDAQERSRMMRLAAVLDDVKKRNPNTSWSGVSIGSMMKDMGDAMVTMLGANTVLGRMAIRTVTAPVREGWNAARMRSATGGGAGVLPVGRLPPQIAGPAGGIAGQTEK